MQPLLIFSDYHLIKAAIFKQVGMKRFKLLMVTSTSGIAFMCLLFFASGKIINRKNNFVRLIPSHALLIENGIKLDVNSYYYAGMQGDFVYLANKTSFLYILRVRLPSMDTSLIILKIPYTKDVNFDKLHTQIIDGKAVLMDPVSKIILDGTLTDSKYSVSRVPVPFGPGTFIDSNTFVFQTYDAKKGIQILNKYNVQQDTQVKTSLALGRNDEGLFATDGTTLKMSGNDYLFVYRYKNLWLKMDSTLKIIATYTTIDTNTIAKVKSAYIKSKQEITMAAPPLVINKLCAVDKHRLYILSPLMADNETRSNFEMADPIDIYGLKDGQYQYSIYLPKVDNKSARSFIVKEGLLVAFYEKSIESFKLNDVWRK